MRVMQRLALYRLPKIHDCKIPTTEWVYHETRKEDWWARPTNEGDHDLRCRQDSSYWQNQGSQERSKQRNSETVTHHSWSDGRTEARMVNALSTIGKKKISRRRWHLNPKPTNSKTSLSWERATSSGCWTIDQSQTSTKHKCTYQQS